MYSIVLSVLVIYILLFPDQAIKAASFGLVLWYTRILPTLLPLTILSYIFVESGILNSFTSLLHKGVKWLIPISNAGMYPLIAGFLFGFPLGSKITAQMVGNGQMDYEEGNRLFPICNNISPLFISSFILHTSLGKPELTLPTYLLLYAPPLVYFKLTAPRNKTSNAFVNTKNAAPRSQINFKIIDAGIMSGFETLTKLGGYIVLFAILAQLTTVIPLKNPMLSCFLVGITEITNGIAYIAKTTFSFETKYLLMVFCTAFGGLSGFAQTASMTKEAGFSMGNYLKTRIICSISSLILAIIYLRFR